MGRKRVADSKHSSETAPTSSDARGDQRGPRVPPSKEEASTNDNNGRRYNLRKPSTSQVISGKSKEVGCDRLTGKRLKCAQGVKQKQVDIDHKEELPVLGTRANQFIREKGSDEDPEDVPPSLEVRSMAEHEILRDGCSLGDMLMAEVPTCPPQYSERAMAGTRGPTTIDFQLPKVGLSAEMLVHWRDFLDSASEEMLGIFEKIRIPATTFTAAKVLGPFHPAIKKIRALREVHSEADIAYITRDILLATSQFALQILNLVPNLKDVPEFMLTEELIQTALDDNQFFIHSSEPISLNGLSIDEANQKASAIPDLIMSILRLTSSALDERKDGNGEASGSTRMDLNYAATIELKSLAAMEAADELSSVIPSAGGIEYEVTGYNWPRSTDDTISKAEKMVCQV